MDESPVFVVRPIPVRFGVPRVRGHGQSVVVRRAGQTVYKPTFGQNAFPAVRFMNLTVGVHIGVSPEIITVGIARAHAVHKQSRVGVCEIPVIYGKEYVHIAVRHMEPIQRAVFFRCAVRGYR